MPELALISYPALLRPLEPTLPVVRTSPGAAADCPPLAPAGDGGRSSSGIASFDTVFEAGRASPAEHSALPRPMPALPLAGAVLNTRALTGDVLPLGALVRAGTAPPAGAAVAHQGFIPYKWRHHSSAGVGAHSGGSGGGALGGPEARVPAAGTGSSKPRDALLESQKRAAAHVEAPVLLQPPGKRLQGAYSSKVQQGC